MADTSAAHYQHLASQASTSYHQAMSQKAAVDAQISRLETAKTNLKKEINHFQSDVIGKMSKIEGEDSSQFKGERKNKYTEQQALVSSAASKNKSSHDSNLSSIAAKIAELQSQSASLQSAASTAYNQMVSYQASAQAANTE
ncbi:DUF5082 domain-containing protein [Streptococcus panodentis]|uniref:DUF5082 domain-containing protein n=1 Tax=Streptococcus panodentis TaxID=1581472 RepID=A0ABS5AZ31_9STRE|nr:DUF5082 domain-containing protein [Streptococcus panodentis]MBP2621835.1 DUF5082 domain-containing protein [Streptococcus panodentis]